MTTSLMAVVLYLCSSVGWSALGFVAGVLTIRTASHLGLVAEVVPPEESMTPPEKAHPRLIAGRFRVFNVVVGVVLVVIGVFSAVSGLMLEQRTAALVARNVSQDQKDRELIRCQQAYANGFADALEARTGASADAQNALDSWMKIVRDVIATPAVDQPSRAAALEKFQEATTEYLDKREKSKQQQQRNPFPPPPREC